MSEEMLALYARITALENRLAAAEARIAELEKPKVDSSVVFAERGIPSHHARLGITRADAVPRFQPNLTEDEP